MILLNDALEVVGRTAASEPRLEALLAPGPGEPVVPASVYNVAAQLLAVEHGIDHNPARSRAHLAGGVWVTLRAARLASRPARISSAGVVAVTIEETTPDERAEVFALAFGLSRRKRECSRCCRPGGIPVGWLVTYASPRTPCRTTSARSSPRPGHQRDRNLSLAQPAGEYRRVDQTSG